jgi:hypothetical protein
VPIQPQTVITDWISVTHSHVVPNHLVKQKVMKDTASNKYLLTFLHLAKLEPMIEYLPSLLQNAKSTFNIFLDTLQISRKVTFAGRVVRARVRTNRCWPSEITIVTDQIHTSVQFNGTIGIIILPCGVGKQLTESDVTKIIVVLDDVLVIATSKLWSIDCQNPAIKICETLKRKGWIPLFPLCMVMVAGRTICPFYMDHIHRTNTTWQPYGVVVPTYAMQLGDIPRNANILIFHFHKGLNENEKNLRTSEVHMPHNGLQE